MIMKTIIALLATPFLLWVFYAAIMRLKQVRDAGSLTRAQTVFGYLALAIGLVLDFFVNVMIGSLVFLELPREWTLSGRLWRLSQTGAGWRQRWALALRVALLDAIDPAGEHRG